MSASKIVRYFVLCLSPLSAVVADCPVLRAETASHPPILAEYPLARALQVASDTHEHISRNVRDYTCVFVKRERVGGKLTRHQFMTAKVRHERRRDDRVVTPFSVYLRFMGPPKVKGREVLYVDGQNDGKLIARKGGGRFSYVTVSLDPNNESAMHDNRYPITEIGIQNLVKRLIEFGEKEMEHELARDECQVKFFSQAKVNGRQCTSIHLTYPVRHETLHFHMIRVFIDDELRVPIRYEAYDWPEVEGGPPRLLEEYTYLEMKLNVGLTDEDFQRMKLGALFP